MYLAFTACTYPVLLAPLPSSLPLLHSSTPPISRPFPPFLKTLLSLTSYPLADF